MTEGTDSIIMILVSIIVTSALVISGYGIFEDSIGESVNGMFESVVQNVEESEEEEEEKERVVVKKEEVVEEEVVEEEVVEEESKGIIQLRLEVIKEPLTEEEESYLTFIFVSILVTLAGMSYIKVSYTD